MDFFCECNKAFFSLPLLVKCGEETEGPRSMFSGLGGVWGEEDPHRHFSVEWEGELFLELSLLDVIVGNDATFRDIFTFVAPKPKFSSLAPSALARYGTCI